MYDYTSNNLIILKQGIWESYGSTMIKDVFLKELAAAVGDSGVNTYLVTSRVKASANPTLIITGKVYGGNIPIKVVIIITNARIKLAILLVFFIVTTFTATNLLFASYNNILNINSIYLLLFNFVV